MKKLKLTSKERTALRQSIKHWERDIIAKLSLGIPIDDGYNYGTHCPLCKAFHDDDVDAPLESVCVWCPYQKAYGVECDARNGKGHIGHFLKYFLNPTLHTACAMVASLQRILDTEVPNG